MSEIEKGGAQGAPDEKRAKAAKDKAYAAEQAELRKLLPGKTVEQLRSQWQGPILKVPPRLAEKVQDSRELKRIRVAGIKVLGVHKARPNPSVRDRKLGRVQREETFVLLACDQAEYDAKITEIAEAWKKVTA